MVYLSNINNNKETDNYIDHLIYNNYTDFSNYTINTEYNKFSDNNEYLINIASIENERKNFIYSTNIIVEKNTITDIIKNNSINTMNISSTIFYS